MMKKVSKIIGREFIDDKNNFFLFFICLSCTSDNIIQNEKTRFLQYLQRIFY